MFKRILIGVDGSPQSLRAAKIGGNLARTMNADVYIVVAYDPIPRELSEALVGPMIGTRITKAEEIYNMAVQECGNAPAKATKEILEGPPAEAILSVTESRSIDLIVMGTRGEGRIASIFLGSQSSKVVAAAPCPVLLVK